MQELLASWFPHVTEKPYEFYESICETLIMTGWAGVLMFLVGLILGVALVVTKEHGILQNRAVFQVLDKLINLFRSIPFVILIALLMNVTRLIMGTRIGVRGVIVPLVAGSVPFFARQVETALAGVDPGLIEAAKAMGCRPAGIILRVYLKEGAAAIARGAIITLINLVGLTAMAGWWMGALSMLCFSLGTVPLMLGVGLVGGRLNQKFAKPMRVISALLVVLMGMSMLTSGLALAGVGVAAKPMGEDGFAVIQGDRQYVRSEIDYGGYPAITVQAGIPVEWTIHAEESRLNGCNNEIVVPAYGLNIPLSAGDNMVEFTPTASGVIPYTCWMGMIHGSIYVVDSLEDTDAVQSLIEQADLNEAAIIDVGVNGASDLVGCCASVLAGASDAGFDSAAYSGGCCGAATAVDSETVPETSAAIYGCCIP